MPGADPSADRADASLLLGGDVLCVLPAGVRTLMVGRSRSADVTLAHDRRVSRTHARLLNMGGRWLIEDDGLSHNGSYVNGERVHGRRTLRDRDRLRVGGTEMLFCVDVPDTARRSASILAELAGGDPAALAPTNTTIAGRVGLSVPAVRATIADLYARHGLDGLPDAQARRRLAALAGEADR